MTSFPLLVYPALSLLYPIPAMRALTILWNSSQKPPPWEFLDPSWSLMGTPPIKSFTRTFHRKRCCMIGQGSDGLDTGWVWKTDSTNEKRERGWGTWISNDYEKTWLNWEGPGTQPEESVHQGAEPQGTGLRSCLPMDSTRWTMRTRTLKGTTSFSVLLGSWTLNS